MNLEFTGERVVPGLVDVNLWNEHLARYAFAAKWARGARVLDAGCGTGYGSHLLAGADAARVVAFDQSQDAVRYAAEHFPHARSAFLQATCEALPFATHSFDLVIAFEVIEHLPDWPAFVREAGRILHPEGQFVVSTPNREFYAVDREQAGPNPFHHHEFEYSEFRRELGAVFKHVEVYLEDHTEGVLFRSPAHDTLHAESVFPGPAPQPEQASFFVAVCSQGPKPPSGSFLYIPESANLLRTRAEHIASLESEVRLKDGWLMKARHEHDEALELYRAQLREVERRTEWGQELDRRLVAAAAIIAELGKEKVELVQAYEAKLEELDRENLQKTEWAVETERRLTAEINGLQTSLEQSARLLNEADQTIIERTHWAQNEQALRERREAEIQAARDSRWIRLGRKVGLGPELGSE